MNNKETFIMAIGGALSAVVVWNVWELLFAAEPSLLSALLGGLGFGLAWIVGISFFRGRSAKRSAEES